jgi:hypothetical protein
MTNRLRWGAAVALMAGVMACDAGADRAPAGETDEWTDAERTEAERTERSAPAQVMPIDHSGVTGTAVADREDDHVTVTLSLEGLRQGATYLAHLHDGRCADDGPQRAPLGRVTANDDGMTTIELQAEGADLPMGDSWSVQLETDTGEAVACANLTPR